VTRLTTIQPTPEESEAINLVASKLTRILDASDKFVSDVSSPPVPGSPMDRAFTVHQREAFDMAYLLIFSAEDHLRTILQVIKSGLVPGFALFTLLRAAAEAVVRCRHLLDPGIDHPARLGRALNERLDNLQEQRKVRSDDAEMNQHYRERVAYLEERAGAEGVKVIHARTKYGSDGEVIGFREVVRSDLALFEQYVPVGSTAFRFLSGYVHSKPWVQVTPSRALPADEEGVTYIATDLNIVLFAGMLDTTLDLHDQNIGFWHTLAGYPVDVWQAAKESPATPTVPAAPTS
jgi:hypothetical protein